jgi:hypothetical protein
MTYFDFMSLFIIYVKIEMYKTIILPVVLYES